MDPEEKVGLLVKEGPAYRVIEYSEIPDFEKRARQPSGRLKHCCASLSLLCFSVPFIQQMALNQSLLPLHKAWKTARSVNDQGTTSVSSQPIAWKFETFIFDWLFHTNRVAALIYPRWLCFAPLKALSGSDSPEAVRAALQKVDQRYIEVLTGMEAPSFPFELSPEFYYLSPELKKKWVGRSVTTPYVTP